MKRIHKIALVVVAGTIVAIGVTAASGAQQRKPTPPLSNVESSEDLGNGVVRDKLKNGLDSYRVTPPDAPSAQQVRDARPEAEVDISELNGAKYERLGPQPTLTPGTPTEYKSGDEVKAVDTGERSPGLDVTKDPGRRNFPDAMDPKNDPRVKTKP